MADAKRKRDEGSLLDRSPVLSLERLAELCRLPRERIIAYVEEGIIEPGEGAAGKSESWRFSRLAVIRTRQACRLEHDLGLNPPGVALALELMERVEELQRRLKRFEGDE
jgi:chaperone modulatory protein CbpM